MALLGMTIRELPAGGKTRAWGELPVDVIGVCGVYLLVTSGSLTFWGPTHVAGLLRGVKD